MAGAGKARIADQDNTGHMAAVRNHRLLVSAALEQTVSGGFPIQFGDSPSIDAFDRLRVSNPIGLFESTQTYDKQTLLWNEALTAGGTATFRPNESATRLAVTNNGDAAVRQTKDYFRYQPGKSQLVFCTFNFTAGDPNVRKRVGYFEAQNGIFLEEIDGALWIVRRTYTSGAVVDNRIAQADWNLDTFSDLDPTKTQILIIDMEWLGVGRVRVGFVIDGIIRYAHEFLNANSLTVVYMTTAQLPVRYEIEATGAPAGVTNFDQICCSVISEGGQEASIGFPFAAGSITMTSIGGARVPVVSIRPKTSFNGLTNRVQIIQRQIETLFSGNNGLGYVDVIYNGTLTGAAFASVDAQSVMEFDVAATAVAGGIVVRRYYANATNQSSSSGEAFVLGRLPISLDIAGSTPDRLTIAVSLISGTLNAAGGFNWQEYR